ncbi:Lrp/AsnC ligand binding domain-containing protein [Chryseobacterium indologenes]|uniref:Lrp/AsnC ligand binding domain-containing protein n=1 Tax=Chryseobacterium indologenes TaxID=253 RepID=UPI0030189CE8
MIYSAPEVQQCYYVTGESDFVLIIVVSSMKDYEQLTRRIFYGNDNIKHFRTLVSMNTVKSGLEIPIHMLL